MKYERGILTIAIKHKNPRLTLVLLLGLCLFTSCAELDQDSKPSASSDEDNPGDDTADPPSEVVGTFLADLNCTDFDKLSKKEDTPHRVGCVVLDREEQEKRFEIELDQAILNVKFGGKESSVPIIKNSGSSPWSLFLELNGSAVKTLEKISLSVSKDGVESILETDQVDWEHSANSLFWGWIAGIEEKILRTATEAEGVYVEKLHSDLVPEAAIATRTGPTSEFATKIPKEGALLFASDFHVKANVGVEFFDRVCMTSGQILDPTRTYKAIVSTSKQSAKSRFDLAGVLYNSRGDEISDDAAVLFTNSNLSHDEAFIFTESGLPLTDPIPGAPAEDKVIFKAMTLIEYKFWSGTDPNGTYDGEGICNDWTSEDASLTGATGRMNSEAFLDIFAAKSSGEKSNRSCSRRARLLCLGTK
jgi:hypothetical protein